MRFHLFVAFALVLLSTAAEAACPHQIKTPLSVLSLYNPPYLNRLENENLIAQLCPDDGKRCRAAALAPAHDIIPVYAEPDQDRLGQLVVTYTPGRGMTAIFEDQSKAADYVPTVFDSDWGYGPWFHATLLETREGWHKIVLPMIGAAWVNLPQAEVLRFGDEKERVYDFGDRPVVLISMVDGYVELRAEQPADMPCSLDAPAVLKPVEAQRIGLDVFYTDSCELKLIPAYKRGC